MLRFALLALFCAACVESGEVRCADGRLCAPGTTCDDENMRCLSADQVAACAGREEGAECSFGGAPGACRRGACDPLVCGDGVRSLGEACDGEDLGAKTCVDAGFYEPDGLACSEFCTFDTAACAGYCGDDIVNGDELCDGAPPPVSQCIAYGFDVGRASCSDLACALTFATCGRIGWVPEPSTLSVIYALDGTSESDLWVVGDDFQANKRMVAHFDGSIWTSHVLPIMNFAISITTAAPGDVWIVGDKSSTLAPVLLRLVNDQWTSVTGVPSNDYRHVWARGASEVYLATRDAGVQLWNGSSWQEVGDASDPIAFIRGTAANDLWAATESGGLLHWNGVAWLPSAVAVSVMYIDALAPDNVWVSGSSGSKGAVAHWNGATWTVRIDAETAFTTYPSVAAFAANDAWVSSSIGNAHHFDGTHWLNADQVVVNASAGGHVAMKRFGSMIVAAGYDGYVYRYRGASYARYSPSSNMAGPYFGFVATWSAAPDHLIAIDARASAFHFDGFRWTKRTIDADTVPQNNRAIWGASRSAVWVASTNGRIHHWNGNTWSKAHEVVASPFSDVFGTSANDVWFAGNAVVHFNGATYDTVIISGAPPSFRAVAGSGPNDVWLIGSLPTGGTEIFRWNGATWSSTHSDRTVVDLVVLAPDLAFAVALDNVVMRWNGMTWSEQSLPTSASDPVSVIAATAHDDAFVATEQLLFHFDGVQWTPARTPVDDLVFNRKIFNLWAAPDRIDLSYNGSFGLTSGQQWPIRRLVRTRFWSCRASETACSDGVDDDCDGNVDALDSDC